MKLYSRLAFASMLFFVLAAIAQAESFASETESAKTHRGQGYFFFSPGAVCLDGRCSQRVHFGGGGEGLVYKGLGLGAEVGLLAPWRSFSESIGMFSANGSYHFQRDRKVSPFVTAGYSMGFREGHINLVNFGGGINWWMNDKVGLRLEFRDHIYSDSHFSRTDRFHYLGGRIGIALR